MLVIRNGSKKGLDGKGEAGREANDKEVNWRGMFLYIERWSGEIAGQEGEGVQNYGDLHERVCVTLSGAFTTERRVCPPWCATLLQQSQVLGQ